MYSLPSSSVYLPLESGAEPQTRSVPALPVTARPTSPVTSWVKLCALESASAGVTPLAARPKTSVSPETPSMYPIEPVSFASSCSLPWS